MWGFIKYTFNGTTFLLGTLIGGVTIAAFVARQWGLELPEFPETLIGLYERLRWFLFEWWTPDWWPVALSDLIMLYLTIGFAILRSWTFLRNDRKSPFETEPDQRVLIDLYQFVFAWPRYVAHMIRNLYLPQIRSLNKILYRQLLAVLGSIILTGTFAVALLQWEYVQNLAGF